ncbi:unnamed protein product [Lactuca saligna]|uniref:RING-type domain-containing protein n=1 Tax=Lactuca saligna TaxID=75948 RepID=A0AA36E4A4_LACSI|nr:unnamed protein product [Lactuca saligna]
MGSKEPFDCAVCLCEFSEQDKLRSLPLCSHAFHIHCIDNLLLSNSSCPLCRGTLFTPGFLVENPVLDFHDDSREEDDHVLGVPCNFKQSGGGIKSGCIRFKNKQQQGYSKYVIHVLLAVSTYSYWLRTSCCLGIYLSSTCIRTVLDSAAQSFCHQLVQMCQESGMEFKSESVVPIYSARQDQVNKALRHVYTAIVKQTWRNRVGIAYYHSP